MVAFFDQAIISTGNTLQRANYAFFVVLGIWVYDFVLTFGEDVKFILEAKWRIPTLLYLACRYLPCTIVAIGVSQIIQSELSLKACTTYSTINTYIGGTVLFCAESLFMRRVWAISRPKRWISILAFCHLVLILTAVVVALTLYKISSIVLQSPIPQISSCYTSKTGDVVILAYIILVIAEIEILSLLLYYSWKFHRESGHVTPLVRILIRHNVSYFICGLFLSILVVVSIFVVSPVYFSMLSELQIILHAILVTRMHRELWRAAHHDEADSLGSLSVIVFARPLSGSA